MKACARCGAFIPDESRYCPSCGGAQGPGQAAPPPVPPPGAAGPGPAPAEGPPPPTFHRQEAEDRVRTLGMLYIVMAGMLLAGVAVSYLLYATGAVAGSIERDLERAPDERTREMLLQLRELYAHTLAVGISHLVPLLLGGLYLWSGIQLRSLRGYVPAVISAILLTAGFLCTPCCCCVTTPLGIYALVVLTRADTEAVLRP